ncbi:SulP family inorganic anion transporter [Nitriliruptoria bacterium AS10]|nr:SulP family inorganic anion transporter [Salsipaludibacter albus]MBY5163934.1 SulP family inorganic anion transporter [Salsipaludibacter albus]
MGPAAGAGLPGAIGGVPDGMAAATLAGVNPIHGLYATAVGRIAGGLTASSQLMVVTTTSAAALAAGSALAPVASEDRLAALFLLTMLAGAAMVVAGLVGLGRFTGFVSHSVMIGFLTGVAANIVLGQVQVVAGVADPDGGSSLTRAWDVVTHPGTWDLPTMLVAGLAFALLLGLARTRLAPAGSVVALVATAVAVWLLDAGGVALVRDAGDIPQGLPLPALPQLRLVSLDLLAGAAAVAVIVLVQSAGVAESAPNPDGRRADADRDFAAQGIANLVAGLFRGMPVGGSVGQTAINVASGASNRWAAILSGAWVLVVLVLLSGVVGAVPSATLAAVLVVASLGGIRPTTIASVWRAGPQSQVAMVTTFVATLFLPVAAAVGIGVALSLILQVNRESMDLRVVELVELGDGRIREQEPPAVLPDGSVTTLDVHGSLFYAGARSLESVLPDPTGVHEPVVVLRLRGRASLGATAFTVLSHYAERLAEAGGKLYVSGLDPDLAAAFHHVVDLDLAQHIEVFPARPVLGESTRAAKGHARAWLLERSPELDVDEPRSRPSPLVRGWNWLRDRVRPPSP